MSLFEAALLEVAATLDSLAIPYMVIGGVAVSIWGAPRATLDIDVSVWVEPADLEQTVRRLGDRFRVSCPDPVDFVRQTRVLPALTSQNVKVDIVFAALEFERSLLSRSVGKRLGRNVIRVVSLEDLVLMKIISERPKDDEDARALIQLHRESIDAAYLEPRLKKLADSLAQPEILTRFRSMLAGR